MKISILLASAALLAGPLAGTAYSQGNDELAGANRELQEARENLERAAREVARLSGAANAPFVGGIMRNAQFPSRRAMLGINIADDEAGVRVVGVSPGGPADEGGVQTGDIITAINGSELVSAASSAPSEVLIGYMAQVEPGEDVVLTIVREGNEHEVAVEADARGARFFADDTFTAPMPPQFRGDVAGPMPPMFGFRAVGPLGRWSDMELVELTPTLGAYFGTETGILVVRAPSDGELELQDGDVILEIGGRAPMSREHAMRILGSFEVGETLELTIMRDQRRQTLEIEITAGGHRG